MKLLLYVHMNMYSNISYIFWESKENTFWTTVLGFQLHKGFFISSRKIMQAVGKDTVPRWWKEYIRLWDQFVLNRKLLRKKTPRNGSYITLMCTLADMLRKLYQVWTLPHTVCPQKRIVTYTWSPKWLSMASRKVVIVEKSTVAQDQCWYPEVPLKAVKVIKCQPPCITSWLFFPLKDHVGQDTD